MSTEAPTSRNSDVREEHREATTDDDRARARTWLKPAQVEQLRNVCLTDAVPTYLQDRNEALVALLYDAGLRADEACGLDVDHFDLDAGTIYLPSEMQKGDPPPATLGKRRLTSDRSSRSAVRIAFGDGRAGGCDR